MDPFSSGAHLSAMVLKWGYKLILVFTTQETTISHAMKGVTNISAASNTNQMQHAHVEDSSFNNYLKPTLLIQHRSACALEFHLWFSRCLIGHKMWINLERYKQR